jgi:hypothetical protein
MKRSHWILMALGCLVPLAAIVGVLVFDLPLNTVVLWGLLLLCPLIHLVMMGSMGHGHTMPSGANGADQPLEE